MKRGRVSRWVWLASAALCAVAGFVQPGLQAEQGVLEGDPFRGRTLFVEKRCVQCHSVWGHGGTVGPEIVSVVARKSLPSLAGSFWNHTPRMIEEMTATGYSWPTLERSEMADILSYLYYVRLFDEPGDAGRGATFYRSLRCEFCHALGGRGGDSGPALDEYAAYGSPVPLAQAMWNSGPEMHQSQLRSDTPIPEFIGSEIVDMQAYIRASGIQREKRRSKLLPLPDPLRGEKVFQAKGCPKCHDPGRGGAPELGEAALRMTVGQISGVLWNHSYAMHDQMRKTGTAFPRFREHELADVISYLYFINYRGRPGDASRGANVFREKGCAVCHETETGQAPDLTDLHAGDDSIGLSAAMWNHAPEMHEVMAEYGVPWPKFEEGEMEDMVAFLRGGSRAAGRRAMTARPEVLAFGCRVDDLSLLSEAFDRIEPDLRVMNDASELTRQAVTHRPLAIVLGFGKASVSHLGIIPVIHAVRSELPVIVIAENASLNLERTARQEKIFYYLVHPIERSEVEVVLQDLIRCAKD